MQFKKFCKLNSLSKRAFFELHAFCLRYVFEEWRQMIGEHGKDNIHLLMGSFSTCLERTKQVLHTLLEDRIGDVQSLIYRLDGQINQKRKSKKNQILEK